MLTMNVTKKELLEALPAGPMRTAHRNQTLAFIWESIKAWATADEISRSDIMAFFTSGGPAMVADARRRLGTT
jgi:hypothetical protein